MSKKPRSAAAKMSEKDIELALQAAKLNLRLYGTVYPSKEAQQLARVELGSKKCPHCGETKNIKQHFGAVMRKRANGTTYQAPNGWCISCRGSKDAHPGR